MMRLTRRTWQPAAFTAADLWVLLGGLVAIASIRGLDYATGNDNVAQSLSVVEDAFPLVVWGVLTLSAAGVLLIGVACHAHGLVFAGHGFLAGIYAALAVGIVLSVASLSWWDGIRSAGDLLFFAALHLVLCLRTGPRPLRPSESRVVTTVEAPRT